MTSTIKYVLPLAGMLLLAACGDDSSSSPATSRQEFIQDEDNQKFAIIYDRCYVSESTTRWDENVDTVWFRYKFIGDTLVYTRDRVTRDEGEIMVGGHAGSLFGTWKSVKEDCYYEDGEIDCRDDEYAEEYYSDVIFTLDVSKSNLVMFWEMEDSYCPAEDLKYTLEDLFYVNLRRDDYPIVTNTDCSTVKFEINGKSVTATISANIDRNNVYTKEETYTSGKKTCVSVFKKVHKMVQMPESLCNTDDMSYYMQKGSGYPREYEVDNDDEFYSCLSEMIGMELEY